MKSIEKFIVPHNPISKTKFYSCSLLKNAFFLLAFHSISFASQAKNYYFSSSTGNDTYTSTQAQSAATPWKTTSKLNSFFSSLVAGDNIFLKCGDVFYGTIIVNKSGSSGIPITISSYGAGNKPVISGFTTLSSWTLVSTGIYQATAAGISNTVNIVTVNNQPQAIGRFPNLNAANGGYLNFESSTSNTITDNELTASPNWTGAELVLRKAKHVMEHWPIASHTGGTIAYQPTSSAYPTTYNGYGYFVQKDIRCLDQLGEWFYNTSTKYLQMYFGTSTPSSYVVKVSTIDILLNTSGFSYITINNLGFEGADKNAVNIGSLSTNSSNVAITNCSINFSGRDAIYATNADYPRVESCNIDNSYSNSIEIENEGGTSTFATIRYNTINNSGSRPGMGASFGNSHQGITAYCTDALIEYNNIDSSGYIGIAFYYNNAKVRNNYITNFSFVKDDGGGIYTWTGPVGGPVYSGREIKNNILINAIGAAKGTPNLQNTASGIYMDDGVTGVDISGNSIANAALSGLYIHNTHEVNITNNTVYNSSEQILFVHDNITPTDPIRNIVFKRNIMVAKTASQLCFNIRSILNDLNQTGPTDSNYYARPVDDGIVLGALSSVIKTAFSLEGWKATFPTKDMHSKTSPKKILPYVINSLLKGNLLTNGDFASNMSGISFWSQNANQSTTWDGTTKLTGTGSLRIGFPLSVANTYTLCTKPVGAISSSKNYIFRFSTLGTTPFGTLRVYLKNSATNGNLVPIQLGSFATSRKEHEFLFSAPITAAAASLVIEIQQNSGTTYVDNIELFEANTTAINIDTQLRFEYNPTSVTKTISLDAKYIGIDSTIYNGSIILQPYTSKVLINNGPFTGTPPPQTITATATLPAISCFGNTTTVTVTGSGGTTPYTGTGSYLINAGKGSLKISVAAAIAGAYTLLYSNIGTVSNAKTYVLRFSTLGTTANGSLRASIRQTNTPWGYITPRQSSTFGTTRVDHQFIFTAPATEAAASFLIEILQTSGTTYIDNVAFFEATTSGALISNNLYSSGQFEASISGITAWSAANNHVAALDLTSKITNTYYYPVKDATGAISTATAVTTQPAAALIATATAAKIGTTGTTTVVVSATGGTAPYTGTGSFANVKAGTYSYTVTDAKGCTSVTTLTAARVAATNTISIANQTLSSNSLALEASPLLINSYPNPTTTEFSLLVTGGTTELINISVASIDGRIVYKTHGTSNKKYIFGNTFMTGMYIIQVIQGNTMLTAKVIKVR